MKKPLKYYLRLDDTTYYILVGGVVTTTAIDSTSADGTYLDADGNSIEVTGLVNWDEFSIDQKRGDQYRLGVFRTYGPEKVKAIDQIASICRKIFVGALSESVLQLEIHYLNHSTMAYELLQVTDMDFSKYSSTQENDTVSIPLLEAGSPALLKSNYDTVYSIPITTSDCSYVKAEGVVIKGSYHWIVFTDGNSGGISINTYNNGGAGDKSALSFGAYYRNREGDFDVLANNNQSNGVVIGYGGSGGYFERAYLYVPVVNSTGTLTGKMEFSYVNQLGGSTGHEKQLFEVVMGIYSTADWTTPVSETVLWTDPLGLTDLGEARTGVFDTSISGEVPLTLTSNEFALFYFKITPENPETTMEGSLVSYTVTSDGFLHIDWACQQPATAVRAYSHIELANKLFAAAGLTVVSDYLTDGIDASGNYDLNPLYTYFTCGDAIRGLYLDAEGNPKDPEIRTSIKEFLQDLFARCGGSCGINDTGDIVLERLRYFFANTLIVDLGTDVVDVEFTPMTTHLGNTFAVGYKNQTYDDVNGRYEYNSSQSYKNGLLRTVKKIDYTTPYRFDCYGIEFTRANLANKKSTDSGSDNDTFGFQCDGTTESFDSVTCQIIDKSHTITAGLPADVIASVYNIACTPKRNLLRLGQWLYSNMYLAPSADVTFLNGEKNTALVSEMYSGPITEADPLVTSDFVAYFYPIGITLTSTADISINTATAGTAKYGYVSFTYKGNTIQAFVWGGIGVHPGNENVYKYDLIWSNTTPLPTEL